LILAGAALAFVALVGCGSSTAIPPEVPAVTTAVVTASAKSAAPTPDVAFITPIPPSFPTPGNLLAATVSPSQLPPPTASPSVTAVPHAHHLHPGVCRGSTDGYETGYANGVTVPGSADEHESPGAVDIHSDT